MQGCTMWHFQQLAFCTATYLQYGTHFFHFRDEIGEEFGHVFLLARVERLVIHRVDLAEAARVVRLAFTLLSAETMLDLHTIL